MKGYKAFTKELRSYNGFQYEIGKEYTLEGDLKICENGFHFCDSIADCYHFYYPIDQNIRICEIEATGDIISDALSNNKLFRKINTAKKYCTNKIKIIREITNPLKNTNQTNTSTGYFNTGDYNTGDLNIGAYNTGKSNTGHHNTGECNSGNHNTGDYNNGDFNTSDFNIGAYNCGKCNTGDYNTGNFNSSNNNTGSGNVGDNNTGDCNIGCYNTGYDNSGNYNTGRCNNGDRNTGDFNIGKYNSGHWNSGRHNSGVFNTDKNPKIKMFDKDSEWTMTDWKESKARHIMDFCLFSRTQFIHISNMTEEEKVNHPECETIEGYIKTIIVTNEDRQEWWDNLSEEDKQEVLNLPNFDAAKFEECTGIKVKVQ